MPRRQEDDGTTHLRTAVAELLAAESSQNCSWCASHIRSVRVLTEDLVHLAELGDDIGRGEIGNLARRIGTTAEEIGALGMLGRLLHRIKGVH
jgi:hypothetical protein